MELQETRCPNCDGAIRAGPQAREVTCEFCQQTFPVRLGAGVARRTVPDKETRRQARTIVIVVVVVVGLVLALVLGTCLCATVQVGKVVSSVKQAGQLVKTQRKVQGTVTSKGGALSDFTIELTSCRGGEQYGFFGVDVFIEGDDRPRLRYFRDPARGDLINVTIPGTDQGLVLGQSSCKVLEGQIKKHGYAAGRRVYWAFDGKLRFDCAHSGGSGRVSGSMTFRDCM